ncbi:MAG TPA: MFS transporter [Actinomycetota bacterium]
MEQAPAIGDRERLVRRNTHRLVVAQGAIQLSFPPLLVIGAVAASEMTGNDGATGLLWAVYFCAAAVGAIAIGRWMDRVGRRPGLLLAYALSAVAGVGSALAIVADSFALLLACAIPFGLASGGANLGRAAVADMYPPQERGRAIGWLLAIGTIGAIGGPLLVALLQDVAEARGLDPWVLPWIVVPVGAIGAIVAVLGVRPDPRDLAVVETGAPAGGRPPRELLRVPAFRIAVLAAAVGQVVMVGIMGVTPTALHALHHGGTAISVVISVHVAGMFAFAPLIGRWMDRTGHRSGLVWGCVVSITGAMITATEASAWIIGLGLFAIGIGWSATFLGATAVISDATQPDERAGALGFTDLLVSLCSAVAGLAGGLVLEAYGFGPLGIGLAAVVAVVLLIVLRMRDPGVPGRVASGA